jgi:hypothetical protein
MGLQLARPILRKRTSENKQIFIVTDGQPTAHVEGDMVYLLYPRTSAARSPTLKEAVTAVREGCRISTFALIEDYWGMDWVGFVDQLTRLTKGRRLLHQQRRARELHHGELPERAKEEGVHRLMTLAVFCDSLTEAVRSCVGCSTVIAITAMLVAVSRLQPCTPPRHLPQRVPAVPGRSGRR